MTIWRMRIACWIPKATNKHSEYVIIIAFLRQQWFHECVSLLPYTYIACFCFLLWRNSPTRALVDSFLRFLYHTHRQVSQRVISSLQRPLPTQQTHQTNIHALRGAETLDSSNPEAGYPRLRAEGHRHRQIQQIYVTYFNFCPNR